MTTAARVLERYGEDEAGVAAAGAGSGASGGAARGGAPGETSPAVSIGTSWCFRKENAPNADVLGSKMGNSVVVCVAILSAGA